MRHDRVLTGTVLLLLSASSICRAQTAESGLRYETNGKPTIPLAGTSELSEYKLGGNQAIADIEQDNKVPRSVKYSVLADQDKSDELVATVTGKAGAFGVQTVSTATTTINTVKTVAAGGYSYKGLLDTSVVPTIRFLGASGFARANFRDPQFVSVPDIYASDFTLLAGTKLFSDGFLADGAFDVGFSLAADFYNGTGNPIDELGLQIFEIVASRSSSIIDVSVTFSSDPRLEFFSSTTDAPITASDVRSMILSAPGLGDSTGLLSDLPLFYYTMDLTGTTLESSAAFGSLATSHAKAVPEPSSLALMGCGVMGLIVIRLRKRTCAV